MIIMPPDIRRAVWLSRTEFPRGKPRGSWEKHYILAYTPDFMFRIFNKPDGSYLGNLVEDVPEFRFESTFLKKVEEKEAKGHRSTGATWNEGQEQWESPPMAAIAGRPLRLLEPKVKVVALEHPQRNSDYITLELMRCKTGAYRLDQYETARDIHQAGFPLWQTLFSNEERAQAVLKEVVDKKMNQHGYETRIFGQKPHPRGLAAKYPLSPLAASMGGGSNDWFFAI